LLPVQLIKYGPIKLASMITANFPSNLPLAAALTVRQAQGSVRSNVLSSVDKESIASGVDVVARVHVRNKDAIAVSAHKYTIRETVDSPNVKRVVRNSPVAGPRVHRKVVSVAGASAGITRAENKDRILSGTAIEFVVVGTLRHANLAACDALTLSVNGSSWADFGDGRLELGLDVTIDGGDIRASGTFAQRRSEDEAGKNGEWEDDSGETHFVEMDEVV